MKTKRILSALVLIVVFAAGARADEGMWLLPLLEKMNSKTLTEMGCKLSAKEIYDINNSSLKDAIVQFGGGCTGEIVSGEGLLLTNHHCGYRNIQKLSSVENDYLKDGFWAMNRSEELPCEGLEVTFLEKMIDVTKQLSKAKNKGDAIKALIEKTEKENPHCEATVVNFYNNNVQYLVIYKVYKDVRFVGAPPSSIGKFGADTDNWMWPRHTGDFSIFRVYADKDNNPAEYSLNNVPYKAKNFLKISIAGVNEGDFAMIMGYPGRTTRFQTSPELAFQLEQNDIRIAARTIRQQQMLEEMLADPAVKIQYASKYSGSSNGWKKWQGMKLAFDKLDILGRAKAEEAEFTKWVNKKKKRQKNYGSVLTNIDTYISEGRNVKNAFILTYETLYNIEISKFAYSFSRRAQRELKGDTPADTLAALEQAYKLIEPNYKDYSLAVDKKVAKAMVDFYQERAQTKLFTNSDITANEFLNTLFAESDFVSKESLKEAIDTKGWKILTEDPAVSFGADIVKILWAEQDLIKDHENKLASARQLYTKAFLEWKKGEASYPDANFTMRLTYGKVGGYSPRDGVTYKYYTTLDGVMEKEDPNNWEFVVPGKLKELWETEDFGDYAMANGKMPTCFLTNNDITGGNSGSPVLNARGELIGLAFDGNWESMSSDVMFEPELQRCINVDIRYVLFIIDKYGGASWLIDEMTIVN